MESGGETEESCPGRAHAGMGGTLTRAEKQWKHIERDAARNYRMVAGLLRSPVSLPSVVRRIESGLAKATRTLAEIDRKLARITRKQAEMKRRLRKGSS